MPVLATDTILGRQATVSDTAANLPARAGVVSALTRIERWSIVISPVHIARGDRLVALPFCQPGLSCGDLRRAV
jgi:hypothetical protein